jgi:hypothetical protein
MTILTKQILQEIILEELQHFNPNLKNAYNPRRPPYVYIFESKRKSPSKVKLSHLFEAHKRGLISEKQIIKSWERSLFWEADLIQEQFGDTIKKGVKKVKDVGADLIQKIKAWISKALDSAIMLIVKGQQLIDDVIGVLKKIWNKVIGWTKKHPYLAAACGLLIIAIIVLGAFMAVNAGIKPGAPGSTGGAVGMCENKELRETCMAQDGTFMTSFKVDIAKGMIQDMKSSGGDLFGKVDLTEVKAKAINALNACSEAKEAQELKGAAGKFAQTFLDTSSELVEQAKAAQKSGDPTGGGVVDSIMSLMEKGRGLSARIIKTGNQTAIELYKLKSKIT